MEKVQTSGCQSLTDIEGVLPKCRSAAVPAAAMSANQNMMGIFLVQTTHRRPLFCVFGILRAYCPNAGARLSQPQQCSPTRISWAFSSCRPPTGDLFSVSLAFGQFALDLRPGPPLAYILAYKLL
jgi:hypothetical protein